MFADSAGFPVDKGGDGGDSINRAGQIACLTGNWPVNPARFCLKDGFVRHPAQTPWNNPKNLTRDQIAPFVAGVYSTGVNASDVITRLLIKAHLGRRFFAPNVERDFPGTTKYPFPHTFINDHGIFEFRWFDFADILSPDVYGMIKMCSTKSITRSLIGSDWNELSIEALCKRVVDDDDDWNTLCLGIAYGNSKALSFYKKNRDWEKVIHNYWIDTREDSYMASLWTNFITNCVR